MGADDSKKAVTAEEALASILGTSQGPNALLGHPPSAEEFLRLSREQRAPNALAAAVNTWTAPTEDEFNNTWFLPEEILVEQSHRTEGIAEMVAVTEELKAGVIIAVARNAEINGNIQRFAKIPRSAWKSASDSEIDHFWSRRQLIVTEGGTTGYGDGTTNRYLDIKFDPASLSGHPKMVDEEDMGPPPILPPNPHVGEEEYREWIKPSALLKRLEGHLEIAAAITEIFRRLEHGELLSVVRRATWFRKDGLFELKEFERLGSFLWAMNKAPEEDALIWKTGTHTLTRPDWPDSDTRYKVDCFGIRFDPDGVEQILADCGIEASGEDPTPAKSAPARTRHIGTEEMRRFSKLYLEIWGAAAKEIPAWEAMKACYPDGIIGRDTFLAEFRELRGPGRRGNPSIRGG